MLLPASVRGGITKRGTHRKTMDATQMRQGCLSLLSLGELRSTTSALESVLLSFLHTRVSGEEACSLESGLVCFVSENESTGDTVSDSTCLSGETAALNGSDNVELACCACSAEGLGDDEVESVKTEVFFNGLAVNGDNTCAGKNANASNRLLSSACAVESGLCTCISHSELLLSQIKVQLQRASEQPGCGFRRHKP